MNSFLLKLLKATNSATYIWMCDSILIMMLFLYNLEIKSYPLIYDIAIYDPELRFYVQC